MKSTIIVDFDGVIHSYTSKWAGEGVAKDPPVPGAIDFLFRAIRDFRVAIVSSRSATDAGRQCMQDYIERWALAEGHDLNDVQCLFDNLEFPVDKPPAVLSIDDRAFCFKGTFPTTQEIKEFKPWNK